MAKQPAAKRKKLKPVKDASINFRCTQAQVDKAFALAERRNCESMAELFRKLVEEEIERLENSAQ